MNKDRLNFEVKMRFFEPPNFSLTSEGEEVVLARVCNLEAAQIFVKAYALEALHELGETNLNSIYDLTPEDDFGVTFNVGDIYMAVMFGKEVEDMVTVMDFKIERVCPACGYNPNDQPYCMDPTHCPICGTIIEDLSEKATASSDHSDTDTSETFEVILFESSVDQKGHWIEHPYNSPFGYKYECSICHGGSDLATDFCPHCGIGMLKLCFEDISDIDRIDDENSWNDADAALLF